MLYELMRLVPLYRNVRAELRKQAPNGHVQAQEPRAFACASLSPVIADVHALKERMLTICLENGLQELTDECVHLLRAALDMYLKDILAGTGAVPDCTGEAGGCLRSCVCVFVYVRG